MTNRNTDSSSTVVPNTRLRITGVALGLLTALWAYLVISAPIDSTQGMGLSASLRYC